MFISRDAKDGAIQVLPIQTSINVIFFFIEKKCFSVLPGIRTLATWTTTTRITVA